MAKKKPKGTNGYVAELNRLVKEEYNGEIPAKLTILIRKTAQDQMMLDRICTEIMKEDDLISQENGSMFQQKTIVNPLIPYYDKLSARVTDDLYNLGLTARKQAQKTEENIKVDKADPMAKMMEDAQKALEE